MSLNHFKSMFKQSTYYLGGNVLLAVCGFISFPVWTRVLSKEDYGFFSLVVITIMMMSSFSKFGLQHAVLRYYPFKEKQGREELSSYYSTIVISSVLIGFLICFVIAISFNGINSVLGKQTLAGFVLVAAVLGLSNSVISVLLNFFRAAQNARLYTLVEVFKRYSNFILAVFFVLVLLWGLKGIFIGWIITDSVVLLFLFFVLGSRYNFRLDFKLFSLKLLKEALAYGVPLIAFEISTVLLSIGDRYLIEYYMGEASVGTYSAGYNLSSYMAEFFSTPLRLAVIPMFLKLWEHSGEEETNRFISSLFKYYIMAGIVIIFGAVYLKDLIVPILASNKFRESSVIIPYILPPSIIYGAFFIYGAGFFIKKRTFELAWVTFFAAIVNLVLNIVLIPYYGLIGAAAATFIAYLLLSYLIFFYSMKHIRLNIPYLQLLKYIFLGLAAASIPAFATRIYLFVILSKVLLGSFLYILGLFILDKTCEKDLVEQGSAA